jgi:(p)ppGpp synthase/HD superfamily hydrolase
MKRKSPTLEDAILLATQAHQGKLDKGGQPYILHPLRIMLRLKTDVERIVGVLHDVVEDTKYTFADLKRRGYCDVVLDALDCVTKRENEPYDKFIERAKTNPVARQVKLADLEDNMDVRRLSLTPSDKDLERLRQYRKAWEQLK